jgi:hypothetical protein
MHIDWFVLLGLIKFEHLLIGIGKKQILKWSLIILIKIDELLHFLSIGSGLPCVICVHRAEILIGSMFLYSLN